MIICSTIHSIKSVTTTDASQKKYGRYKQIPSFIKQNWFEDNLFGLEMMELRNDCRLRCPEYSVNRETVEIINVRSFEYGWGEQLDSNGTLTPVIFGKFRIKMVLYEIELVRIEGSSVTNSWNILLWIFRKWL